MSAHNAAQENYGAANAQLADPGAGGTIYVDRNPCCVNVVTAAAEARTLAAPDRSGLIVTVALKTDGGDLALTVTNMNQTGNDTATAADAGDAITFTSIALGSSYVWRVLANDGYTLS